MGDNGATQNTVLEAPSSTLMSGSSHYFIHLVISTPLVWFKILVTIHLETGCIHIIYQLLHRYVALSSLTAKHYSFSNYTKCVDLTHIIQFIYIHLTSSSWVKIESIFYNFVSSWKLFVFGNHFPVDIMLESDKILPLIIIPNDQVSNQRRALRGMAMIDTI